MLRFNFRKPSKIFDWICFKFTLFWKYLIGNIHHNKYTMIKKNSRFIISSFISLFLGTVIYILFRTSSLKVFSWLKYFGIDFLNSSLRKESIKWAENIPHWILFSLPDGLWSFSYISLILGIWRGNISQSNIFWIILIPIVSISLEIAQYFGFIQGTFDIIDVFFYFIGSILPFLIFRKTIIFNFINQRK